jgi:hypothetical protein
MGPFRKLWSLRTLGRILIFHRELLQLNVVDVYMLSRLYRVGCPTDHLAVLADDLSLFNRMCAHLVAALNRLTHNNPFNRCSFEELCESYDHVVRGVQTEKIRLGLMCTHNIPRQKDGPRKKGTSVGLKWVAVMLVASVLVCAAPFEQEADTPRCTILYNTSGCPFQAPN